MQRIGPWLDPYILWRLNRLLRIDAATDGYCRPDDRTVRTSKEELTMFAALGIILIVGGAIIAFAIDTAVDNVDLQAVGYIMMAGGAVSLLVAAIQGLGWMSRSNRKFETERHMSADGQHYVEETHTS